MILLTDLAIRLHDKAKQKRNEFEIERREKEPIERKWKKYGKFWNDGELGPTFRYYDLFKKNMDWLKDVPYDKNPDYTLEDLEPIYVEMKRKRENHEFQTECAQKQIVKNINKIMNDEPEKPSFGTYDPSMDDELNL